MPAPSRPSNALARPGRVIATAFAVTIAIGTALLLLPASVQPGHHATVLDALFTATSALCVTGHVIVDTGTFWSPFGQGVVLGLIQVGGFGVMSSATLFGLLVARRLGLRTRLTAVSETHGVGPGDVKRVLRGVGLITLVVESSVAIVLAVRWTITDDTSPGQTIWTAVFHSVSAFNNAGFSLRPDSLVRYSTDPWTCIPICVAVIAGGLGFPVIMELRKRLLTPRLWTLNTMTVVVGTIVLLVVGAATITVLEWSNPRTLGALEPAQRLLAGFTAGVMPRTAGFNNIDIGAMHPASWLVTDVLMFIGTGPAGTGGGLKITTFAVLFSIVVAELRGDAAVNLFNKRLPRSTHREALTVALVSVALIVTATFAIMLMTDVRLDRVLFEVISAFSTVGLSTGITAGLPPAAQLILVGLMFIGRLGPVALGSSLALTRTARVYELPKERPIIG